MTNPQEDNTEQRQTTETKKADNKKQSDEEKLNEIIWESLSKLHSESEAIHRAVDSEQNPKKLATLANASTKTHQGIYLGVALLRNPKFKLSSDPRRAADLASMMKRALLSENPTVKKMVGEAKKQKEEEDPEKAKPDTSSQGGE